MQNNEEYLNSKSSVESELVKVSNAFARGEWGITGIMAPRIIMNVAMQVKRNDNEFYNYEVPFGDISESPRLGLKTRTELLDVAERLLDHRVRLDREGGGIALYRLFAKFDIDFDKQVVVVNFHPDLKNDFLALKGKFTLISYINFVSLNTAYSQRLYRLLSSWKNTESKVIELEDLHFTLETPQSVRDNFSDFNRRILDKSLSEINEKTELSVRGKAQRRNGRKVVAIEFIFLNTHDSDEKKRLIGVIVNEFGVSEREATLRSANKSEETLEAFVKYMRGVIKKKSNISDIASYATTTLANFVPPVKKEDNGISKSFFQSLSESSVLAWQKKYIEEQKIPENLENIVMQGLNESNEDFLRFITQAKEERETEKAEPVERKISETWDKAKLILKANLSQAYATWIEPVDFWAEDDKTFQLIAPEGDKYFTTYLKTHYLSDIEDALEELGVTKEVTFFIV